VRVAAALAPAADEPWRARGLPLHAQYDHYLTVCRKYKSCVSIGMDIALHVLSNCLGSALVPQETD